MAKELIINASLPETRIVLLESGTIQDLWIERTADKGVVGNIYKGKVTRVLPGMQAAFVDIGLDKAAFLYVDDVYVHPDEVMFADEDLDTGDESDDSMEADEPDDSSDEVEMSETEGDIEENEVSGEGEAKAEKNILQKWIDGIKTMAGIPVRHESQLPDQYLSQIADDGSLETDRSLINLKEEGYTDPDQVSHVNLSHKKQMMKLRKGSRRGNFKGRSKDRRVRSKFGNRNFRPKVNIQDLLSEGQEVIVQVSKEPIATKGARLTCHVSLPGRHLVCMPTLDHVGVSRRIEKEDDRRKLRKFVEQNKPGKIGFIVRTASGGKDSEKWIQEDMDYLSETWKEVLEAASKAEAPAMIYEDFNPVLRAVRDWVNEDIDRIIVDSKEHFEEIKKFSHKFMPSLGSKIEAYHGDIPIFDAYGISTELHRALDRRVWLKSGGYIVIDQAEALVAIDVNTGRYVGKKNLEETILKTNLEAVREIAYQLRLRNLGGIIIIDLIDMEKEENRHRVYRVLEDSLKHDRARPTLLKMSELGLIEMTRKRTRDTMVRVLCESCSYCEGKGFIKSKETVAFEVLREIEREGIQRDVKRVLVQASPAVIDFLALDQGDTLASLEQKYRKQVYLQADYDSHPEQFEVLGERTPGQHQNQQQQRNQQPNRDRDRDRGRRNNRNRRNQDSQPQAQQKGPVPQQPQTIIQPNPVPVPTSQEATGLEIRPDEIEDQPPQNYVHEDPTTDVLSAPGVSIDDGSTPTVVIAPSEYPQEQETAEGGDDDLSDHQPYSDESDSDPDSDSEPFDRMDDGGEADDYNEEDRLAFLRAQAAQDAAIAGLSAPQNSRSNLSNGGKSGPNGGGGDYRNNRNRRNRPTNRRKKKRFRGKQEGGSSGPAARSDGGSGTSGGGSTPQ